MKTLLRHDGRGPRGFARLEDLRRDLRHALRTLARTPGFSAVAILTLALGIGANTAVFSVADPLIERPLPIRDLNRVAAVAIGFKGQVTPADYFDWKRSAQSFSELAAYRVNSVNLTGGRVPERLFASEVTPEFFDVIRIRPALGRVPGTDETMPGGGRVAVLSDGFWRRHFGADTDVLGRVLDLNGQPYTIIGVMPKGVEFPAATDVWVPLVLTGPERAGRGENDRVLRVIGRLTPAATMKTAQAEMSGIARRLAAAYPATNTGRRAHVLPLAEFVQGSILCDALFLLLGIVTVVLLIVSVNIAGLQLARGASRAGELAVRTALGATGRRVAQMLFVENLALAVVSGAIGILVAWGLLRLLLYSMPGEIARQIPGWDQIGLDSRALVFTAVIALGSGVAAGLLPAWTASRRNPNEALKDGARRASAGLARRRLRAVFVAGQIAMALVLVVTGVVFVQGFHGLLSRAGAHDPDHVLVMSVDLPPARYAGAQSMVRFYQMTMRRLHALPGVASVATLSTIPMSNNGTDWISIGIEGQPSARGRRARAVLQSVSPDYFDTLRIGLRAGRSFTSDDRADGAPVAIVSATLAARRWPDSSPIGKRIRMGGDGAWLRVVGVADDVLYDWTDRVPEEVVYRPMAQAPAAAGMLAIRTTTDPAALTASVRTTLAAVDPLLPAYNVETLRRAIAESLAGNPQVLSLVGLLGSLALIIALIGIYSLVAHIVTEGTHEFGIRMALGADRSEIVLFVMRRGLWLTLAGVGVGVPASFLLVKLLRVFAYGVGANSVPLLFEVAGLLAVMVLLACAIPARRAANVDPIVALRHE